MREEKIPAARALLLFKAPAIVWAPIQAYCCAEISRAPFGSLRLQRHAADPLVVLGSDMWLDRCVAPATITTGCGPLPSLLKHSIIVFFVFFFSPTQCSLLKNEHLQANIPIVLSLFLLYSFSALVYMLIVLWSTLIIHMAIF